MDNTTPASDTVVRAAAAATTVTTASAHKPTAARTSRVLHHASEYVRNLAHEPSVGQYYVREHVHKSVKQLTEAEATIRAATRDASEGRFDAKGAMEAVASMHAHGEDQRECLTFFFFFLHFTIIFS